jgi:hypothetical protein
MPRFNEFLYNTALYGDKSKLLFSAEPMVATAINYNWIDVRYSVPDGGEDGYVGFRIVRSQDGYPETEDDGVIIYELLGVGLQPDGKTISDNVELWIPFTGLAEGAVAPLLQEGQFAYYRAWVLKTPSGDWVPAGDCFTLLPKKHGLSGGYAVRSVLEGTDIVDRPTEFTLSSSTHDRFMSYIPSVFTSRTNSVLDERNPAEYSGNEGDTGGEQNTLLSSFLSAFSFTIDEMLTFAANTLPPSSGGQFTSPEILALQSSQFSIPLDSLGASKTQKRLVRDSIRNYARKGTAGALLDFVQDVTNYSTTITESRNKLLGHENSTFDIEGWIPGDPVGQWLVTSYSGTTPTATITVDATQTIAEVSTAIDLTYSAKIVTTAADATVALGAHSPITKGVPVVGGVTYRLSYQGKRSGSTGGIQTTVTWYDNLGNVVVPDSGDTPTVGSEAMTTSFARVDSTWVSPINATYASIELLFTVANTYWVDMVMLYEPEYSAVTFADGDGTTVTYEGSNSYAVGDVINVRGVVPSSFNISYGTVTGVTYNSRGKQTGFTVLSSVTDTFTSGGAASKFDSTFTYYQEARGVLIHLNPSKTNYIRNPSFEDSSEDVWTTNNCMVETISNGLGELYSGPIGARTSSYRRRVTSTSSSNSYITQTTSSDAAYQVPKNKVYTFSVYIRSNVGTAANPLVLTNGLQLGYVDSVDGTVSNYKTLNLTGEWQRVTASIWVPDNKVAGQVFVTIQGFVTGQSIELDAAQLEVGDTATDYFDGALTTSGCAWERGSVNSGQSYSVKYPNLSYRVSRLTAGLQDYLPMNTPWAVEYLDNDLSPQQYSGIS